MKTLEEVTEKTMRRLEDSDAVVWSTAEIEDYLIDGSNQFCRRTRGLFDIHVVENVPQAGNWGLDLERFLAEQTPGMGLTDKRLHFTGERERDLGVEGRVGGSTEGPTAATSPSDTSYLNSFEQSVRVDTARLPEITVDVLRVTWDDIELFPEDSADMRRLDTQYERREGGDPRHFTLDKDGLLTIRLVPPARGDATYATVDGSWGTMTFTDDSAVTAHLGGFEGFGILREVEGAFPAGGLNGSPTRQHPDDKNTKVEITRLGRPLRSYGFEIPDSYVKYCMFWAMYRALQREGPGQNLKLSQHYAARFEVGVARAKTRLRKINKEYTVLMGAMGAEREAFDLGDPQLPYPYGSPGRKIL